MNLPVAITAVGMITGVGLNAPACCAAIRCAIDNFQETRFIDKGGKWLLGCSIPLDQAWRGASKQLQMAKIAIQECLTQKSSLFPENTPLLLCLAETQRSGRVIKNDHAFFAELQQILGIQFHDKSRVIAAGRVSLGIALQHARILIHEQHFKHVLIAATDSLLVASTLASLEEKDYLLSSKNSDGFIPGEAGAAIIIEPVYHKSEPQLICQGIGFGLEKAHIESEESLRADGLTIAIKQALQDASCAMHDLDFRVTDISGQHYYFKEATLALGRTLRARKETFDIWHPADCIGETGAAIGLIILGVIKTACEKNYSLGSRILIHLGLDDGRRVACITQWGSSEVNRDD